jgi:hypothetical protein
MHDIHKQLEAWHDFYVVVGTAGAALTGLLFVMVSLGPHVVAHHTHTGVRAFISPIATHFTTVLIASCVMLIPNLPLPLLGGSIALGGAGGAAYTVWTRVHKRWRENKLPVLDGIWFVALPFFGYLLTLAAGTLIAIENPLGFYGIAAAVLLFVVVAIRNAWDVVIWLTQQQPKEERGSRKK